MEAPRLIEQLLLCQNADCHTPLGAGHMPWTSGRIDLVCGKCRMVSRFAMTNEGILASVVPPSSKLAAKR